MSGTVTPGEAAILKTMREAIDVLKVISDKLDKPMIQVNPDPFLYRAPIEAISTVFIQEQNDPRRAQPVMTDGGI
jgi:hypothetical protein